MASDKHLRCSFCGKSKDSVKRFISGPSVYICNECISLCNEILAEEEIKEAATTATPVPTPNEIKKVLAQTLARVLHVPFTIVDATTLTEAGYVGEDVENILVRLLQAADFNVAECE